MFLKSLLLRGFKTFADQTEIDFSSGAGCTAIVGPNGCGKSNLLDAARWVMGEDNPRELRVAALENIIFAGTAEKKSLSLAEVTLVFDNSAGKLAVPFSEVSIKRRTYREGESEFYINKNACRLKDIKSLLLDTGLGEGTYSIITQGQVDALLSRKGEERRTVFEEAAGINKYKTRKLSAEKKLIAAEQNLLRISDLKIEVGEQIITLENQARRAREYLDVQARVKETELALGKKLLSGLLEKQKKLKDDLEKTKKATEEQIAAELREEEELQSIKTRLKEIEQKIDEQLARLDSEKDRLRDIDLGRRFVEGELQAEQGRRRDLEKRKEELLKKVESIKQQAEIGYEVSADPLVNLLIEQSKELFSLLSSILSFWGRAEIFSLASGGQREETKKLKLELMEEELKRIDNEIEKTSLNLDNHKIELGKLPSADGSANIKQEMIDAIARSKKEREELNLKINSIENRIRQARSMADNSSALEVALAKIEGEMAGLSEKFSIEYNLTLEEILAQDIEISNITKAKSEVEEGRRRLRELEPVNLLAIEEYEKTKERLSFIDAQLEDLNSARENLRNLIVELDLQAEETFIKTMDQLSQVFSETFSKLFVGGEAKIMLSPGAPALEADIEISVRPSGRKWLPLPLLSGGERSLSAIAILFSLLRIRPAPFCFLDEVDAALDEANIGRFTELLKDFSSNTQMIVITHNKMTMAAADNIYGITMEEPGVSKVISMKLAESTV